MVAITKKAVCLLIIFIILVALASACAGNAGQNGGASTDSTGPGASSSSTTDQGGNVDVKIINVAHSAASRPMEYVNDNGESDGYEVAVLREIDALLPQYEFNFVPIPDDSDLLIGTETGKYEMSVKAAWITEERLEKFIFPEHPIGASSIGLLIRSEDKDRYTDLEAFAKEKGRLIPISPQSAQYSVILDFNEQHPDSPIELIPAEVFDTADAYRWVIEGRYDGYFATKTGYQRTIKEEGSPYHQYDDILDYFVYRSLACWPLFNRSQQELADAYDLAFMQLLENGRIDELMHEYLDENTFDYIIEEEYLYLKGQ